MIQLYEKVKKCTFYILSIKYWQKMRSSLVFSHLEWIMRVKHTTTEVIHFVFNTQPNMVHGKQIAEIQSMYIAAFPYSSFDYLEIYAWQTVNSTTSNAAAQPNMMHYNKFPLTKSIIAIPTKQTSAKHLMLATLPQKL